MVYDENNIWFIKTIVSQILRKHSMIITRTLHHDNQARSIALSANSAGLAVAILFTLFTLPLLFFVPLN